MSKRDNETNLPQLRFMGAMPDSPLKGDAMETMERFDPEMNVLYLKLTIVSFFCGASIGAHVIQFFNLFGF